MKRGFYTIMAAQFFSSLADNALLIASIGLLIQLEGPVWMTPLLKFFFTISYVVLAPFVGPFADAFPKGRVMLVTNTIKVTGCVMMLFYQYIAALGIAPDIAVMLAYGVVGLGAAAYSPAKYGILTELLPPEKLVVANGWIEGLTVGSIIVGTVVGGMLLSPPVSRMLLGFDFPMIDTHVDTPAEAAISVIIIFYIIAAVFNMYIPDTGARYEKQETNPSRLLNQFANSFTVLWGDKLGQISLAVTTLFWGAGATLQFIVLRWADKHLGLPLEKATMLQGVFALGIAVGAVAAARFIPLKKSLHILPVGVVMGVVVLAMDIVYYMPLVYALIISIGAMAGFFVVPMNALLQHRGHVLLSAGHSIAVQNFNENLCILFMLALYAGMLSMQLKIGSIVIMFGLFVALSMLCVIFLHRANQRRFGDAERIIGIEKGESQSHFVDRPH
ncbi:MAG: lysophospholipid transporter LplT [Burkholderiales bacterium]|nr:lysophospholipid transporter LplT [Burkholderiales bacterium]